MTIAVLATDPHPAFKGLAHVDWDDTSSILHHATPLFDAFATGPDLLDKLLNRLAASARLRGMCERYDFMDKLVLHDDPAGWRIRAHLYRSGYFDRPHNHRWSFASMILRGSYLHRIFGRDDHFGEDTDPDSLRPIHECVQTAGSSYALHHTSVHTVQAQADSISILLRGPAAKDRFLILDRARPDASFWVYGAAAESPETQASKQLRPEDVEDTMDRVRALTATAE